MSIFKDVKKHNEFSWETLGDIKQGRENLGEEMPVIVYRLMQFTMLDVLTKKLGKDAADDVFRDAGFLAGKEFAQNALNLDCDFNAFFANLQEVLKDLKIGILRLEAFEKSTGEIVLTVGEDLDCSGLPITNENVCTYDEGFLAGVLNAYTNKTYDVREVDCWANGNRVCRFRGKVK